MGQNLTFMLALATARIFIARACRVVPLLPSDRACRTLRQTRPRPGLRYRGPRRACPDRPAAVLGSPPCAAPKILPAAIAQPKEHAGNTLPLLRHLPPGT